MSHKLEIPTEDFVIVPISTFIKLLSASRPALAQASVPTQVDRSVMERAEELAKMYAPFTAGAGIPLEELESDKDTDSE